MAVLGSITFGVIIGYLSWHAVLASQTNLTLKTIAAFIGVVGGAAITAIFPAGSGLFGAYSFGLGIGFFATPLWKAWTAYLQMRQQWQEQRRLREDTAFRTEIRKVLDNWPAIEDFVRSTLEQSILYIEPNDLTALGLSFPARVFILQEYARRNYKTGVRYERTVLGDHWLYRPREAA